QGLPRAFFVFYQCEPDVVVTVIAKADAWGNGYFGLVEQELRELQRAKGAVWLGNAGPYEHGCPGQGNLPTGFIEAFDEHIAAAAIVFADFGDALLRAFESGNRGHLNRCEGAVIKITFEPGESGDQNRVADHESDAPAGHVVALRQSEELDGDFLGAGDLKDARRPVAIEGNVGVGDVVDEVEAILACQLDEPGEEG